MDCGCCRSWCADCCCGVWSWLYVVLMVQGRASRPCEPCSLSHKPCSADILCRANKSGYPYQSYPFTADNTGSSTDKPIRIQEIQEVKRLLLLSKKTDCCHSDPTEQAPHPNGKQSVFYSNSPSSSSLWQDVSVFSIGSFATISIFNFITFLPFVIGSK